MFRSNVLFSIETLGLGLLYCLFLSVDCQGPRLFETKQDRCITNCSFKDSPGLWDGIGMVIRDFLHQQQEECQNIILIQNVAEKNRQAIMNHLYEDSCAFVEYELKEDFYGEVLDFRNRLEPTEECIVITVVDANSTVRLLEMSRDFLKDGRRFYWFIVLMGGNVSAVRDVVTSSDGITLLDFSSGVTNTSHNESKTEDVFQFDIYRAFATEVSADITHRHDEHDGNLTFFGRWHGFGSLDMHFHPYFEESDFKGLEFKVTSTHHPPFQIRQEVRGDNGHYFTGISFEILDSLATSLNFSYRLLEPTPRSYGTFEDGRWNGMMELLVNKEADIAVGAFSITKRRSDNVDFLWPFWEEPSTFLIATPTAYSFGSVFRPFQTAVWPCLAAAIPLVGVLTWAFFKVNPRRKKYNCNIDLMSCIFQTFGGVWHQGANFVPNNHASRILCINWWLFGVIITTIYTANLVAFLSVQKKALHINTLEELAQDTSLGVVMEKGTALEQLLMDSGPSRPTYNALQKKFEETQIFKSANVTAEMLLKMTVKGEVAFLEELTLSRIYAQKDCKLSISDERFFKANLAFPVKKGFPYTNIFNAKIMRMIEAGLILKWTEKHWPMENDCQQGGPSTALEEHRVTFLETTGAWNLLGIGLATAIISIILEHMWEKYSKFRVKGITFLNI